MKQLWILQKNVFREFLVFRSLRNCLDCIIIINCKKFHDFLKEKSTVIKENWEKFIILV